MSLSAVLRCVVWFSFLWHSYGFDSFEPSANSTSILNFASYIITQNALTDAPQRYAKFIQDAVDWLNAQTFPDQQICESHCCQKYIIYLSRGSHKFTIDDPNGIKLSILSNGFRVWTKYNVVINAPVYVREGGYCAWPIYGCLWTWTLCRNDPSTTTGTATTQMDVNVIWDKTTKKVSIKPLTPTVTLNVNFKTSCDDINDLEKAFGRVKSYINHEIEAAIIQAINVWSSEALHIINYPNTFQAYPGVNVTYFITDLTFSQQNWAKVLTNGYLTAQDPVTKKWRNYTDDNIVDANMQPPQIWPWQQIINQNVTINGKPRMERLWLLNGLRVTSTLLTALVWAANEIGDLTPAYNFTALDATLIFNLKWDKPLLGIPFNGTLSVEMGYGITNGTCYQTSIGPPEHNETVILSFYFTDLIGNGTVELESNSNNISLAIQITDFNTTAVHPVLIRPKLPLPADVIEKMMQMLINASIPLINSYLLQHAMVIPSNYSQWIPNPQLTLIHQSGCCNGTHGYMQFYSLCSCDEKNPLWSPCSNLPCSPTPKPTTKPTIQPSKPTSVAVALPINNIIKAPVIIISDTNIPKNNQIWMNVYSLSKNTIAKHACNYMDVFDVAAMRLINDTKGQCVVLSPLLSTATRYYSLKMSPPNTIQSIKLLCNAGCNACKWPPFGEKIELNVCYEFTYVSNVMLLESSPRPCIGGNLLKSSIKNNKNVIVVTYNGSAKCENSTLVTVQNMGNILDKCVESNTSGTISTLQPIGTANGTLYNLGMNCDKNCSECSSMYVNKKYDTCFDTSTLLKIASKRFMFGYDSDVCGNTESNDESKSVETIPILSSIIIFLFVVIIAMIVYAKRVFLVAQCNDKCSCEPCKRLIANIDCLFLQQFFLWIVQRLLSFKNYIIVCFGISYNPTNIYKQLSDRLKLHNLLLFVATIFIFIQLIAWICQSPWELFDSSSFENIGIPSDALDITDLEIVLTDWQNDAEIYFEAFGGFILFLLCIRFICIGKCCGCEWYEFRVLLLGIYILFVFMGIYLLCPTYYEFAKSVKLNANNQNAFTGSSAVEATVNDLIGYSFVGVFLSYFSNMLLFWMYSIPVGVYFASLFYVYFLFESDDIDVEQNEEVPVINCKQKCMKFSNLTLRNIFKYNGLSKDVKSTMIARIIVIVFLLQAMASCVESLPVVIMYQSFGSNIGWIMAWILWWIIPMFLLYHLWWICNQYIKLLRNEENVRFTPKQCQTHSILNGISELTLFILVMVVSIISESNKTKIAVWFLILTCLTALVISFIFWIFVLHFMFMNTKKVNINSDYNIMNENEEEKQESISRSDTASTTLDMQHDQIGFCFCVVWRCLTEKKEIQKPGKYGERIYLRRLFLTVGTLSFGYISIKDFLNVLNITVKQMVINFLNELNVGVTWPDDDEGGTLFDSTFHVYNEARIIAASCALCAAILFGMSLLCDVCVMGKRGLKLSKIFGWLSMIALMAGIFTPSLPNYISSTPIHDICPFCAPQFTNAVYLLFGDVIGLFCSALFTVDMLPILVVAVIPAIARSSYMVLHSSQKYKLDLNEEDTLRYIFICGSFLGPFTTFAPLLVYQQTMGDVVVSSILIIFWILPIMIAIQIKSKNATFIYLLYMCTYYGSLSAIFVYHCIQYGLPHWLILLLQTPNWIIDTILEIAAEVCLTNVLLSDFLYTIIMGFRTKHKNEKKKRFSIN